MMRNHLFGYHKPVKFGDQSHLETIVRHFKIYFFVATKMTEFLVTKHRQISFFHHFRSGEWEMAGGDGES